MSHQRPAFSLLELLIVIGIILIVMAILIPAIEQSSSVPRKNQCSMHIKNLVLASIQYEMTYEKLPGWVNDFGVYAGQSKTNDVLIDPSDRDADRSLLHPHRKIGTWAVSILPWLDAQPTYEHWTEDRFPIVGGGSDELPLSTGQSGEGFHSLAAPNLWIFQCPSQSTLIASHGRNSYVVNAGLAIGLPPHFEKLDRIQMPGGENREISFADSLASPYGAFNSALVARLPGDIVDEPPMIREGPPIRLSDFLDGAGHTVLVSESVHAMPWHRSGFMDREDLIFTGDPDEVLYPVHSRFTNTMVWHSVDWSGGEKPKDIHRINGPVASGDALALRMNSNNAIDLARPSSQHADGVNVGVADGSTRFIMDTIDMRVWQALMTPAGDDQSLVGEATSF